MKNLMINFTRATMSQNFFRTSKFSFECSACGICCHDKKIQVNPFEIVQMAGYLKISSSEFLKKYIKKEEPFLLFLENGACVFLEGEKCGVHPARPLVCRLYPLGHHLSGDGEEHFTCAQLPEECTGTFGTDGSVARFLGQQETETYMEASNKYLELYYRFYRQVYQRLDETENPAHPSPMKPMLLGEWFDVDALVSRYCEEKKQPFPADIATRMNIHIVALEEKFGLQQEVFP